MHEASAAVSLFNLGSSKMGQAAAASAMAGVAVSAAGFAGPPGAAVGGGGGGLADAQEVQPAPPGWVIKHSTRHPGHIYYERLSDAFSSWEHPGVLGIK